MMPSTGGVKVGSGGSGGREPRCANPRPPPPRGHGSDAAVDWRCFLEKSIFFRQQIPKSKGPESHSSRVRSTCRKASRSETKMVTKLTTARARSGATGRSRVPAASLSPAAARAPFSRTSARAARSPRNAGLSPVRTLGRWSPKSSLKCAATGGPLEALLWDCDGVILLSEHLHREAYNKSFSHHEIEITKGETLVWTEAIYDVLQNTVGGGKPKMRWWFNKHGWPTHKGSSTPPETDDEKTALIDQLQDYKIEAYKDLIANTAESRPGVLRLMKEAREAGMYVAVCSASAKPSVIFCLNNLLGEEQFNLLDCFIAGSDVSNLKPDPEIYNTACERLGVDKSKCLVIEDSMVGLNAAMGAEMDCVITYHSGTEGEAFEGAKLIVNDLSEIKLEDFVACKQRESVVDDRIVNQEA